MTKGLKYKTDRLNRSVALDITEQLLDQLKLESVVFSTLELLGPWGFAKTAMRGAPFHIILNGEAWLRLPLRDESVRLQRGAVAILPRGEAHELTSAPGAELVPFNQVLARIGWPNWEPGMRVSPIVLRLGSGDGEPTRIISGVFAFGDKRRNPLLEALPRLFHLEGAQANPWLSSTIGFMADEIGSHRSGSATVASRLADLLFVQAVRQYLASEATPDTGWIKGLTDPQIGRALHLMHMNRERRWSVNSLAQAVGMSRARFASRFRDLVGRSPLEYLTHWRMHEAAGELMEARACLASVAESAGYRSEVAFSKAFKRAFGQSPTDYRRSAGKALQN